MTKKSKKPKTETLSITSNFLLLDIKKGRKKIAKLVEAGHCIPFVIKGYINAGASGVGYDDGVSIEFASIVEEVTLGTPFLAGE